MRWRVNDFCWCGLRRDCMIASGFRKSVSLPVDSSACGRLRRTVQKNPEVLRCEWVRKLVRYWRSGFHLHLHKCDYRVGKVPLLGLSSLGRLAKVRVKIASFQWAANYSRSHDVPWLAFRRLFLASWLSLAELSVPTTDKKTQINIVTKISTMLLGLHHPVDQHTFPSFTTVSDCVRSKFANS